MRSSSKLFGALVLTVLCGSLPNAGRADIIGTEYDITYNGCGSGCGSLANYGTVSVSGNGTNVLKFDVDLATNYDFHQTNAGTTFQFAISGATVTAANVSGLTTGQGWTFATPTNNLDALGTFQYGFNCSGAGISNTCGSELDFTLTFAA